MKKIVTLLMLPAAVAACGKISSSGTSDEDQGKADAPYTPVEGEEATQHLALTGDAVPLDAAALTGLLAREIDIDSSGAALTAGVGGVAVVTPAELALLKGSEPERASFDPTRLATDPIDTLAPAPTLFEESEASAGLRLWDESKVPPVKEPKDFDFSKDTLDLSAKKWKNRREILISGLGKIPVREQGNRGTCAAHTMAGFLEYKLVKQFPKTIKTIDLSEERLYMMAKSDLWDKGGGRAGIDSGSWMAGATWLSWGWDGYTVKSAPTAYHIPLEVDCPYDPNKGANELHIPQKASCGRGVVSTKRHTVSYWLQKSGEPVKLRSNAIRSAQEIFDFIQKYDLPVPAASNITDQWFKTSGVITLKNEPANAKSYGHGYLIVGARKLDDAKYPGEGGMCWVVKNSWGKGWAQQGLACVTLAWFNKFHQGHEFMFPLELNVDLDYIKQRTKKKASNTKPGAKSTPAAELEANPPVKVAVKKPPENIFASALRLQDDDAEAAEEPNYELPDPDAQVLEDPSVAAEPEAPVVTADGYTEIPLVTPRGVSVLGLYKVEGSEIKLRGVYPDDAGTTTDLTLLFDGTSALSIDVEGRGPITVGALRNGHIALCVEEFRTVCHFNLVPAEGRLVVGLTEGEHVREEADPDASYTTLASLAGYGIEYAPAGAAKVDVRLLLDGTPTNGLRLKLDVASGAILHHGKEIGSLTKLALCSGDYAAVCRLVVGDADRSLHVFFKVGQGN
jgi:hypothetical protein